MAAVLAVLIACIGSAGAEQPSDEPSDGSAQAAANGTPDSVDALLGADLDASQRAFLEAQQAELKSAAAKPRLSPEERRNLRAEHKQARRDRAQQAAQQKVPAQDAAVTGPQADAAAAITAHDTLLAAAAQDLPEEEIWPEAEGVQGSGPVQQAAPAPVAIPGKLFIEFRAEGAAGKAAHPAEDAWVPELSGALGKEFTVQARAELRDTQGGILEAEPDWMVADPSMVTVSPARGKNVRITVRRMGATNVTVRAHGLTRDIWVSVAPDKKKAMTVDILQ